MFLKDFICNIHGFDEGNIKRAFDEWMFRIFNIDFLPAGGYLYSDSGIGISARESISPITLKALANGGGKLALAYDIIAQNLSYKRITTGKLTFIYFYYGMINKHLYDKGIITLSDLGKGLAHYQLSSGDYWKISYVSVDTSGFIDNHVYLVVGSKVVIDLTACANAPF